jgi:hypothetical protein
MQVTVEIPDDLPAEQLAEAKRALESGEFIALRRPPELTNEEVADFVTQAVHVLRGWRER